MNLRQALEKLGPKRVLRGMKAFDNPQYPLNFGSWDTCFIGEAFKRKHFSIWNQLFHDREIGYIGVSFASYPDLRERLRQEAILFLAEHGMAPEPSPTPARKEVLTPAA